MAREPMLFSNIYPESRRRDFGRSVENFLGRRRALPIFEEWQKRCWPSSSTPFCDLLEMLEVPFILPDTRPLREADTVKPLVVVANHPYGVIDGWLIAALLEKMGRSYRAIGRWDITDFMEEYGRFILPIDFSGSEAGRELNENTKREALRNLREGTAVVILPAGKIAKAPYILGGSVEAPWKTFAARMVLATEASVLPIYLVGQIGVLAQAMKKLGPLGNNVGLVIEHYRQLRRPQELRCDGLVPFAALENRSDRHKLTEELRDLVFSMQGRARLAKE